jgi:hypothetical protein
MSRHPVVDGADGCVKRHNGKCHNDQSVGRERLLISAIAYINGSIEPPGGLARAKTIHFCLAVTYRRNGRAAELIDRSSTRRGSARDFFKQDRAVER